MSKINLNALKKNFDKDTMKNVVSDLNLSQSSNISNSISKINLNALKKNFDRDGMMKNVASDLNLSKPSINNENIPQTKTISEGYELTSNTNSSLGNDKIENKAEAIIPQTPTYSSLPSIKSNSEIPSNNNVVAVNTSVSVEKKPVIVPEKIEYKNENLNTLGVKEDLFSNYQSQTKKIETTLIEKVKKLGNSNYIKTNKKFLFLIIFITTIGIGILFFLNPSLHSIQNYKSNILGVYNNISNDGSGQTSLLSGSTDSHNKNVSLSDSKVFKIGGKDFIINKYDGVLFSPDRRSFSFIANESGKQFVLKDGQKSSYYDKIYNLMYSNDSFSLSFIAENAGKQFVVQDGKESNKYDRVYFLKYSSNGNSLSFIAENAGKQFVVQDGKEGNKYDITSPVSYSSNTKDFTFVAEKQGVLSGANDFDHSDFKFLLPSKDWFFLTYEDIISIRGKVPKDIVKKLSINGIDTKVFNGTDWVYNVSVKNNTLKNGINNYEIKYYGDNNNILYTNKYIILKRYKKNSK